MVKINNQEITKNTKIKNKDEIIIDVIKESQRVESEDMGLDIIYEDDSILIVNKDT